MMNFKGLLASIVACVLLAWAPSAGAIGLECLLNGPKPSAGDVDGDGIPDEFDRVPDDPANACVDFDGDLLIDLREYQLGTDPSNWDTDGDRLADGQEVLAGLDPLDPDDALGDGDLDGFPGWYEARRGTDAADPTSSPITPAPVTAGRYVRFLTEVEPAWQTAFAEIYDLNEDGTAAYYTIGNFNESSKATGTWTSDGAFVHIVFDPGQVLSESFPFRPELGRQTQRLVYITERTIGRSLESAGHGSWVVLSKDTESYPELELENELLAFSDERPVKRADVMDPASFAVGTGYQVPCHLDSPVVALGNYIRSCSIVRINDSLAFNQENGTGGEISTGPSGELVIDFGATKMSIYVTVDFGGYQRTVVLIENTDDTFYLEDGVMVETGAATWPDGVVGFYQYPWAFGAGALNSSALVMLDNGLAELRTYSPSAGVWTGSTWGSWRQVGEEIWWERYTARVDGSLRFIFNASECEVLDCRIFARRIIKPVTKIGDELLITHIFEWYDVNVVEGPDVLQRYDKGLRAVIPTPFLDLTLNGIPDEIDPDVDGDGLPDAWERRYFSSQDFGGGAHIMVQRAHDDPDGDGLSNYEEYVSGWHPMLPNPNRPAALQVTGANDGLATVLRDESRGRNFAYGLTVPGAASGAGVAFGTETPVDSGVVPDVSGDGSDEIAVLLWDGGPVEVRSKTMSDGALVSRVYFDQTFSPVSLLVLRDAAGGLGGPAIGVLGIDDAGRARAQVKDAVSGALRGFVWFDPSFTPVAARVLPDMNGNDIEEIAVLGVDAVGRVRAQIKDVGTGALVKLVYFDKTYQPLLFDVMPDVDGDGQPDIGVLGRNAAGDVRLQVKDAASAQLSALVRYETGYEPHALFGTETGSGPVAGVLARNMDGVTRLQTKSLLSGNAYSFVQFDGGLMPKGIQVVGDVSGNGIPEVAVLGLDSSDKAVVQIKDLSTGALVQRTTIME